MWNFLYGLKLYEPKVPIDINISFCDPWYRSLYKLCEPEVPMIICTITNKYLDEYVTCLYINSNTCF